MINSETNVERDRTSVDPLLRSSAQDRCGHGLGNGLVAAAICLSLLAPSVVLAGNSQGKAQVPQDLPDPIEDADFRENGNPAQDKVLLGQFLFFDKILSGNENISCATCHHALTDTGDGLSMPIGEGGNGLGVTRDTGIGSDAVVERVPRNSPTLFNLGATEFTRMFHDGRVELLDEPTVQHPTGFRSPAGTDLPEGLDSVLAVQAMFPVTSATEMAGEAGDNSIADAAAAGDLAGNTGVWSLLAQRLRANPDYVDLFMTAYSDIDEAGDITYVHAANAIGAFEEDAWRADNSPYDQRLRGDGTAMSPQEKRGMRLFYGEAGCAQCHSGKFQTDQDFHAIAMPQIGPGKGDGSDGHDDFGRERVTGEAADRFKFRTPSLRNIALTAPYGHAGAYSDVEGVVRHHLDPVTSLMNYDTSQAELPSRADLDALDFVVMNDPARVQSIAEANEIDPVELSEEEVADLLAFLRALTDPNSIDLRQDVPDELPSGLPLFD